MTPHNTNTPYPGMANNSIEFFVHGNNLKVIHNQTITDFTELPFAVIQLLKEEIDHDLPAKLALHEMHPQSEYNRLEQFAKCRFGGLDFKADIKNNKLQEGEYWSCPNQGKCEAEGVLCKLPKFNGFRLSKTDINLMRLLSSELTNETISEKLGFKLGSFHLLKKNLYQKLNIQTKQGLAIIAMSLNII